MKRIIKKLYLACLAAVPICSAFMLTTLVNSTTCWAQGQDELPKDSKNIVSFK